MKWISIALHVFVVMWLSTHVYASVVLYVPQERQNSVISALAIITALSLWSAWRWGVYVAQIGEKKKHDAPPEPARPAAE